MGRFELYARLQRGVSGDAAPEWRWVLSWPGKGMGLWARRAHGVFRIDPDARYSDGKPLKVTDFFFVST